MTRAASLCSNTIDPQSPLSSSCSGTFFQVQLPSALAAGGKLRVKVETVLTHVLRPFPTHITQAEKQLVVFQGNHYLYSPYPTRSQTTRVRLASKNVESYTKLGNPSKNDDVVEYGPFKDVPPFSQVSMMMCSDFAGCCGYVSVINVSVECMILLSIKGCDACSLEWPAVLLKQIKHILVLNFTTELALIECAVVNMQWTYQQRIFIGFI